MVEIGTLPHQEEEEEEEELVIGMMDVEVEVEVEVVTTRKVRRKLVAMRKIMTLT